jgi:succinyl-CoA synthetase beta subunit
VQIIVDLHIICDSKSYVYTTVRKTFNTDLVPMVGMDIEDSAWEDPREIKRVSMNPTEGYYFLYVGDDRGQNEEDCKQLAEMYRAHGWVDLRYRNR